MSSTPSIIAKRADKKIRAILEEVRDQSGYEVEYQLVRNLAWGYDLVPEEDHG